MVSGNSTTREIPAQDCFYASARLTTHRTCPSCHQPLKGPVSLSGWVRECPWLGLCCPGNRLWAGRLAAGLLEECFSVGDPVLTSDY